MMFRRTAVAGVALVLLAGCSATGRASGPDPAPPAATMGRHAVATAAVSKVLVFVVENHSLDQMRAQMPDVYALAREYGYATDYRALTHPSLGNYIAIAGGSTFGIEDDHSPEARVEQGPSVFSQAVAAGATAKIYAEGMPENCALTNGGSDYVVRHNPWAYFADERADCERYDVPATQLAADVKSGGLPNVGMVVPDVCNDAHNCPLATADRWLQSEIADLLAGPDWRSGRLAVVITADEDHRDQDNLVLTTVLHPSLHHEVVDAPLTHLSLSRFLSEVVHQPPLRDAATAPSLGDAFGLRVGP